MYFLLNDTVFNLSTDDLSPQTVARRFSAVSFDFIQTLGREMYAERPLLHREQPALAAKLCSLLMAKSPAINAALFVAPSPGCKPAQVGVRYATLDMAMVASLYRFQSSNGLTPEVADREVWGRLAAA